ncbi:MAG TPA: ferritin-like domain-containing protein [Propionibacteriaceae bacterium]|nr:ferritin-like domain-containing protein [Propionibacteriaceae bacterium]
MTDKISELFGAGGRSEKGLSDLFLDTLQDMYYAEQHILRTLPELEAAAASDELKAAFRKHTVQTEGQIVRLEDVFQLFDVDAKGRKCEAIEGILKEGDVTLKEFKGSPAADAGLISSAQAVEHYEITRYGTLRRWAQMLGVPNGGDLLSANLEEEAETDELLTRLAETEANAQAALKG